MGGEVGSSQSWNRYSYVLNNPVKLVDPDGESPHVAIGAFIGGAIGTGVALVQEIKRANRRPVSATSVARNIVAGAAGGATTGALAAAAAPATILQAIGGGAGASMIGGGVRRTIDDPSAGTSVLSPSDVISDGVAGGAGGGAGQAAGKTLSAAAKPLIDKQYIRAAGERAAAEANGAGAAIASKVEAPARAALSNINATVFSVGAATGEAVSTVSSHQVPDPDALKFVVPSH